MRGEGGFDGYFWEGFVIEGDSVLFRWRYILMVYLLYIRVFCLCGLVVGGSECGSTGG